MRHLIVTSAVVVLAIADPHAQFRRGILSESTDITLYPLGVPALLLPAGNVQLEVRNASGASSRILERLRDTMARQIGDNDARVNVVPKGADVVVAVTLVEWRESRRSSTKYVSERRQVGTKTSRDKNGNLKIEPVYEYGRNKPSVVIDAGAGLRVEVRRARGAALADETVRHTINEEHLVEEGPPTRDIVEDLLIDQAVQKGAGRISPSRIATRVRLARSDDVDRLNSLAMNRRWQEWLTAISAVKQHPDRKRESYRLHNLAVAHEAIAYESTAPEDWAARLNLANTLIRQAMTMNPSEKYIAESAERIAAGMTRYRQLAEMYQAIGSQPTLRRTAPVSTASEAPAATTPARSSTMTNQDVIDLRAAGLDDDNLIAAIADAKVVSFDLSAAGLKRLLGGNVSNRVIAAMRARSK
jgi:hypothetical protein